MEKAIRRIKEHKNKVFEKDCDRQTVETKLSCIIKELSKAC
jgi:hypothetical protein